MPFLVLIPALFPAASTAFSLVFVPFRHIGASVIINGDIFSPAVYFSSMFIPAITIAPVGTTLFLTHRNTSDHDQMKPYNPVNLGLRLYRTRFI